MALMLAVGIQFISCTAENTETPSYESSPTEGVTLATKFPTLSADRTNEPTISLVCANRDPNVEDFCSVVEVFGIPPYTPFSDATTIVAGQYFFPIFDAHMSSLEKMGIDPFVTWPFCIGANQAMNDIANLIVAESPSEAAAITASLSYLAIVIHDELDAAMQVNSIVDSESRDKCLEFMQSLDK